MLIERPPRWFRNLFPGALFQLPSGEKPGRVFLTFDDGPIPEATPWVLDELDRQNVKATFFMVGQNVERYPRLFKEVTLRGHAIGNHSLHHIKGHGVTPEAYLEDVEQGATLTSSRLFRPPHGWISPRQFRNVRQQNHVVMYDLITRDYSKHVSAQKIVDNVKKYSRDGSIIVFHDSLKSISKLKTALPESIEWLKEQGFRFEVLQGSLVLF